MKLKTLPTSALVLAFLIVSTISVVVIARRSAPPQTAKRSAAQVREAYGELPLSFEENRGQANESVDFVARGPGYVVALSPTEAIFALRKAGYGGGRNELASRVLKINNSFSETARPSQSTVLRMNLVGANRHAAAEALDELEGKVNYLLGNDPAKWRSDVPTFGRVRYRDVYPGIDLVYYGNQRRLEHDFVVAPGQDVQAIELEFAGADSLEIDELTGDLVLSVGGNTIRQKKPLSYQVIGGVRREVEIRYAMRSDGRIKFQVGNYDRGATLTIDPVLVYSTFLGGTGFDFGDGIAIDSAGNAYVMGWTDSSDFPKLNAFQGTYAGVNGDISVTKLNPAGSAILYSTYLGGSESEGAAGIALDANGNVYLAGHTESTDFPTVNPIQAMKGPIDAFIAKLNSTGSALVYSTYLGGSSYDIGYGIAVDSSGNAYVTGYTMSTDFPTANAIQASPSGSTDGFVTKINAAGSALVYSTYLGGNYTDQGFAIAVDAAGNAYVTGDTTSTNFPTANALQAANAGDYSAFVTKINAAGTAFVFSTYLGGSDRDSGRGIAVDSASNAYVTGLTYSTDFPIANALQPKLGTSRAGSDAFVTKISSTGSALVYSTYLGGSGDEFGVDIAVDSAGNAYVAGSTSSTDFPTANPFQATNASASLDEAFVTKINPAGSALVYSSYFGSAGRDNIGAIALGSSGNLFITGVTDSICFPTTVGAFDTSFNGPNDIGVDAFVTKISETESAGPLSRCTGQLLNVAARLRVLTGDGALIGGFVITGSESKRVIIRGIGPSLTNLGVQGALANPTLDLFDANQNLLGSNDDWKSNQAEVEATGIPPKHDNESAIVKTLAPGAYTAVLRGKDNSTGIGMVEVYDLNSAAQATVVNISSRGFVNTGDNVMIGGFIVGGGAAPTRVVIRGIGPSLAAFGITGALQDPIIDLKNADGVTIMSNDDWQQAQPTEINQLHLAPNDSRESALVATLARGNYTAILRGKSNTTGIGVVEVYNVP